MTRCAEWKYYPIPPPKKIINKKRENVGMTWPHPQEMWSSGFSHGEKDAPKRGDLTYILYVWVAQLVRPMEKRKKDNLASSGGYQKKEV